LVKTQVLVRLYFHSLYPVGLICSRSYIYQVLTIYNQMMYDFNLFMKVLSIKYADTVHDFSSLHNKSLH